MRVVRHVSDCPPGARNAVIALGNFDGLHLGHRAVISHAMDIARTSGALCAVMTFEPHPREFFARRNKPDSQRLRMYPLQQKLAMLKQLGVDIVFLPAFNEQLASTSAHDFVSGILHQQLGARHIVTGYDFAFGKGRGGNTDMLAEYASEAGFGFTALPQVAATDVTAISSSAIRTLLADGQVEKANALLGQPYRLSGHVCAGEARGRELGIPTANISLNHVFKPRLGVYAVRARLAGEAQWRDGVAHIGIKATFNPTQPLLEVHLFDFNQSIYGKKLEVEFFRFLRDEMRFDSAESLLAQMHTDISNVKHFFASYHTAPLAS